MTKHSLRGRPQRSEDGRLEESAGRRPDGGRHPGSQSWNRYAYVFNNPLKFVDPTGYQTSGSGEGSGSEGDGEEASYQGERALGPLVVNPQLHSVGKTHHAKTGSVASDSSRLTAPVDWGMETARAPAITEAASQSKTSDKSASLNTGHPATDAPGNNTENRGEAKHSSGHSGWPYARPFRNIDLLSHPEFERGSRELGDTADTLETGLQVATMFTPGTGLGTGVGWLARLTGWARGLFGKSVAKAVPNAVRGSIGFADDAAAVAYQGMRSGGGHAMRHLIDEGLIPNAGSLASRAQTFERLTSPILTNPSAAFNWTVGNTAARAFAGQIGGRQVVVFVAREGAYQGRVISAIVPDAAQVAQWGL